MQAHKVFNTVTFLCASRYFLEMARVTRPGGRIVFDAMTETCLEPAAVRAWASEGGAGHGSYPPRCRARHAWTSSRRSTAAWRPASWRPWASAPRRSLSSRSGPDRRPGGDPREASFADPGAHRRAIWPSTSVCPDAAGARARLVQVCTPACAPRPVPPLTSGRS
ncbi:hypothetical protein QBA75_22905 [Streptomyces stelliscabiei]